MSVKRQIWTNVDSGRAVKNLKNSCTSFMTILFFGALGHVRRMAVWDIFVCQVNDLKKFIKMRIAYEQFSSPSLTNKSNLTQHSINYDRLYIHIKYSFCIPITKSIKVCVLSVKQIHENCFVFFNDAI